jgi:peptide deformylase
MIREIIIYPDKRLQEPSSDVESFDDELHKLLDDMYDTMIAKNGVGLAAIQVAVHKNVLLINPVRDDGEQYKEDLIEAINPIIVDSSGEQVYQEGCLSVPEYYFDVTRAQKITVEYYDRDGNKQTEDYDDFLAVAWQHEIDHLRGHLFIEKLSIIKRRKFEKEIKKKQKSKA